MSSSGESEVDPWKHHDKNIHTLIRRCPEFIVYLDLKLDVDWETTDGFEVLLKERGIDFSKVQGAITCLEAIPIDHLNAGTRAAFRSMLAEAMCVVLSGDIRGAKQLLRQAEQFVVARNHEQARKWFLTAAATTTSLILILSPAAAVAYRWFYAPESQFPTHNILSAGIGGSLGALLSILLRIGRAPLDPAAGESLHYVEGVVRIATGVLGAVVILSAVRSNMLLPGLNEPYGLFMLCVVAGASERLAWAVIEQVESVVSKNNKKPEEGDSSIRNSQTEKE